MERFKRNLTIAATIFQFQYSISPLHSTLKIVTIIILSVNPFISSYLLAMVINQLSILYNDQNSLSSSYYYIVLLAFYTLYDNTIQYINNNSDRKLELEYSTQYTYKLYSKVHDLGISIVENPEIHNKIERASGQKLLIFNFYGNLIRLLASIIAVIVAMVILAPYSWIAVFLIFVTSIPVSYFDKKFRSQIIRFDFSNTEKSKLARTNAESLLELKKIPEIIINQSFDFLNKKYHSYFSWFNSESYNIRKNWYRINVFRNELNTLILCFIIYQLFIDVSLKTISVGIATFIIRTVIDLSSNMSALTQRVNQVMEDTYRINDTYELFRMVAKKDDGTIKMPILTKGPDVIINDLSFAYPGSNKKVLDRLNLDIKSGEKIAIVGHNGAGKTTLIKIICQMYEDYQGEILLNNINAKEIKKASLYSNLSVLFQEYNTYPNLTVKENIFIGNSKQKFKIDEIISAAEKADANKFIEELPDKYDQLLTPTAKGGTSLSSGQWQKLAIARFFYRNASLVIFDEPTAAIDALSEYKIFNQIYNFFNKKTVIIVSHRFSTVRNADRIIVIEQGKIIEQGSHAELIDKNGYYARSFNIQAQGYAK